MFSNANHPPQWSRAGAILFLALSVAGLSLLLFVPGSTAYAVNAQILYDTVTQFNTGTLYHTGLTADTANGGDGDGEIRLLNVGINPNSWIQGGGNHTGLSGRWGHAGAQSGGRIYISGGNNSPLASTSLNTVHYSTIQINHNLSDWTATSTLPGKRYLHGMVVLNGYLYVIGGLDENAVPQSTVYKAQLNANGTLGSWTTTGALPTALSDLTAVVYNGKIIVLGGQDNLGVSSNSVYQAMPDGSGNISSWSSAGTLTNEVSRHASAATSTSIYVAGGAKFTTNNSSFFPEVYYGDGTSSWTQTDPLPVNLVYAAGVAYSGELYIVGGAFNNGATLENNIRTNLINLDASLVVGGWTSSNVLSAPRQRTAAVVSDDGWIYVIQGQSGDLSTGGTPLATIDFGPSVAAGGQSFAPSGTYTSEVIDFGSSRPIQSIVFNTSRTDNTSMSFEYRLSDLANFSDTSYQPAGSPVAGTNVNTTQTLGSTKRYLQFRVNFTGSVLYDETPVLNSVTLNYDAILTPTPTATNTPANTGGATATNSPTNTGAVTATNTPTKTATATSSSTATPTKTKTPPNTTISPSATPCTTKPAKSLQVSPANGANVRVRKVPLAWNAAPCAQTYKIVVRQDSKTGPRVFKKKKYPDTQVVTGALAKGHKHVWKVRACNANGCGVWSGWNDFRVVKGAHLSND